MAAFLKSISLFLMHGRRASRASEAQRAAAAAGSNSHGGGAAGVNSSGVLRGGGGALSAGDGGGGGAQSAGDHRTERRSQRVSGARGRRMQSQPPARKGGSGKCSSAKLVDSLRRRTHFSRPEVEALLRLHRSLAASAQRRPPPRGQPPGLVAPHAAGASRTLLDRASFRELLHNSLDLTEEVLMERIFTAFDRRGEGAIDGEHWVLGLSVMLRGTPAERRAFCFAVYDLNGDGFVSRDEVLLLLAGCLAAPAAQDDDPDEGVRDLADLALRKMDGDRDGKLSFADFEAAVTAEPLLLEAFGNCLPADHTSDSFLATLL